MDVKINSSKLLNEFEDDISSFDMLKTLLGMKSQSVLPYELSIIKEKQLELGLKTTLLLNFGAVLFAATALIYTLIYNPSDAFNEWFYAMSVTFLLDFSILWICIRCHAKGRLTYRFYITAHVISGIIGGIVWCVFPLVFSIALDLNTFLAEEMYLAIMAFSLAWSFPFIQPAFTLITTMLISYLATTLLFPYDKVDASMYPMVLTLAVISYALLIGLLFIITQIFILWTRKSIQSEHKSHLLSIFLQDYEEGATDWMWQTNSEGYIDYASDQMLSLTKLSPLALSNVKFIDIFNSGAPETEQLSKYFSQRMKFIHFRIPISLDGELHYFSLTGKPMLNPSNEFIGFRGVGSDISKIVSMEKAESNREYYEAFIKISSMLSHDFNNLLASIMMRLELSRQKNITSKKRDEHLKESMYVCKKAADITSQMLAYSKKHSLNPKNIPVNKMLHILKEETQGKDVSFEISSAQEYYVWADETLLFTSLANIINNAMRAVGNQGSIYINIEKSILIKETNELDMGEYIHISIEDSGEGFSEEEINQGLVFEPFYSRNRDLGGAGLGLSMVQGFTKQSGGNAIISNGDYGAKIDLYFPAGQQETTATEGVDKSLPENLTILLVEDNMDVSDLLSEYLKQLNTHVTHVTHVKDAIKCLSNNPNINLIVSDFMLPDGTALDITKVAREVRPEVPFVYISGYLDIPLDDSINRDAVLSKPFSLIDLSNAISKVVA